MLFTPVAGREDVDAHDLQLRREHGARVLGALVSGHRRREDLALFDERRHQPVTHAVVLDAFTDGEDVGVGRLHEVVDDDAAIDVQRRFVRELDVGANSRGDDDDVGLENGAVLERDAFGQLVAHNGRRRPPQQHADAEVFHLSGDVVAAVGIELTLHQRPHQVHDGDVAALHLQPASGFEAQKSAANHHRLHARTRKLEQRARVVERSEGQDVLLVETGDRRHERGTAGREQQRVVFASRCRRLRSPS